MNINNRTNNSRNEKELKELITKVSFAMDDTRLFLDTHPNCAEALEYYKKMHRIRHELIKEYTERFGQIVGYHIDDCNPWDWNEAPLPWHSGKRGGC